MQAGEKAEKPDREAVGPPDLLPLDGLPADRGPELFEAFRVPAGPGQRVLRHAPGRSPGAHRPQRGRQDDSLRVSGRRPAGRHRGGALERPRCRSRRTKRRPLLPAGPDRSVGGPARRPDPGPFFPALRGEPDRARASRQSSGPFALPVGERRLPVQGERKRLLLVLALIAPRPVLLFDEPFDGLDLRQAREAEAVLRAAAREGRTLFLSIHQLADAGRVCDRLVLLSAGRVAGEGTLEEFIDNVKAFAYFPYAVASGIEDFQDGEISVRFRLLEWQLDQCAGILFNLKPDGDYWAVRFNAKEDNLVLWKFLSGKRSFVKKGSGTSRFR